MIKTKQKPDELKLKDSYNKQSVNKHLFLYIKGRKNDV